MFPSTAQRLQHLRHHQRNRKEKQYIVFRKARNKSLLRENLNFADPAVLENLAWVAHLHPVSCKVDAQRWLRYLWWHFLGRKIHHPVSVVRAIQAQVLPVGVCLPVELLDTARHSDVSLQRKADQVCLCSRAESMRSPAAHSVVRAFRMPRRRALKSAKMSSGVRIIPQASDADAS